jgi:pyruvate,water dikinase
MEFIRWLDQVSKDDVDIAGGKGANLGEMVKLKIPVPFGFIITSKAFDSFLDSTGIRESIEKFLQATDVDNTEQLLNTSKKIKETIVKQQIPFRIKNEIIDAYRSLSISNRIMSEKALQLISAGRDLALVAVRSSATAEDLPTASFAGQQATFLNVKGIGELINAVKKCWASLYEPRAIFYRAKKGFTKASIAVIVQRMVNSEKSGVMFTVDPATGEDIIVIEATWGLGETLVSGEIEPDLYRVSKDGKILEKHIGKKLKMRIRDYATDRTVEISVPKEKINSQVLTDKEILKLAEYGKILEEHYQHPQDIEFAIERSRISIVQTRAVTTKGKVEEVSTEAKPILKGLGASPGIAKGVVKVVYGLKDITKVQPGDILVTTMTSPDLVPTMSRSAAIITDQGGITSHASIVSREMRIPCIVGTREATKILKDGMFITVDAYHGLIYRGDISIVEEKEKVEEKLPEGIKTQTKLKVNLAFPKNLEEISKKTDGVGLLRIEHMITQFGVHPSKLIKEGRKEDYIKILIEGIKPIAKAFHPKPVWVRTLDARTDEFRNLKGGEKEPKEPNPMLGWHGIRRSLDEPEILKAEFEAVKRLHEDGLDNVHVMLPFIISVDEFKKAREIANEVQLPESVRLGIMVETPAAALDIESFCKEGIDFASFGTNDLTQLVLGVDRNNEKIADLFSEMHPSVLKLLKNVIEVCNRYGIESSICGEAGSKPEMVRYLVKNSIKSISSNIDAIDKIRKVIWETEKTKIPKT